MTEFEIDGHQYRAAKLSAFQQFHLSRRISALIPPLIPVFVQLSKEQGGPNLLTLPALLQPFADALAGMSDEAAEYVISTCLSALKRKQGEHFTPVWSASAKAVMFEDLNDLSAMIPLVVRVIQDSLGPFLQGLATGQVQTANPSP